MCISDSHKLVKFDRNTLSTATTVIEPGLINNPISVVKKSTDAIFLGSYSSNNIVEINTNTWTVTNTLLPAGNNKIQGIDIGMAMDNAGFLYVPGYDSDNILRINTANGNTNQFVGSGQHNLDRPRSVLLLNNQILVTAWGNQAIMGFGLNGQFQGELVSGLPGAAGLIMDGPEHILVTSDTLSTVRRYRLSDFSFETVVPNGSGGLAGATFVYRLPKIRTQTPITGMRQAWMSGVGTIDGNQLLVSEFTTTGGEFGSALDPATIETVYWGDVLFSFDSCHTATMSYASDLTVNEVPFSSGSHAIERLAQNPAGAACDDTGFANMTDASYMSGVFYGGPSRSGEGFTIDYLNTQQAVVTWFTYLPSDCSAC